METKNEEGSPYAGNEPQLIGTNQTKKSDVCGHLSSLYETLKEPIPENPSASYISDAAHRLVDGLNQKRKNDTELIERFKQNLEEQTVKCVQTLEQQLYQTYDAHNLQVDKKLQELFACLDNIAATETELENFRESLRKLYQEMNNLD
ncbi:uncharacterized protein LOC123525181 isoform X2 [Mercenaria mercenaria]|uniref:uncharacterized protein LOC123525181 isoform X2 n=1 Tax=Mercenaria mercenaria TaxID=6596 RepID=UPI00234EAD36|nr:uncharacterized protein LOC123525181 isoform X2 [Mercenaria mercenaria]